MESNLIQMANEIGMIQDGAAVQDLQSAWNDSNTRIDAIQSEITDAHRSLTSGTDSLVNRFENIEDRLDAIDADNTGALDVIDGRLDTLETTVNAASVGLSDRMTAAEYAIDHTTT